MDFYLFWTLRIKAYGQTDEEICPAILDPCTTPRPTAYRKRAIYTEHGSMSKICLSRAEMHILLDPAGILVASLAYTVMVFLLVALVSLIREWLGPYSVASVILQANSVTLLFLCAWAHFATMTTNAGVIHPRRKRHTDKGKADPYSDDSSEEDSTEAEAEMSLAELEESTDDGSLLVFCDNCDLFRPQRAQHCHTCQKCVVLLDHHCPWVNNCVGIGNHKHFLLLLLYASVASIHTILLLSFQYFHCRFTGRVCSYESDAFPGRKGIWILAASVLFGLFCTLMLAMELYTILLEDIYSTIGKQLMPEEASESDLVRRLSVLCGTRGHRWSWWVPLAIRRSHREVEVVYGYSQPSS